MDTTPSESEFQRQTTADGLDTLYSVVYRQTFHSKYGALMETELVFLDGSGVRQRLAAEQATRVLEVGFGTGLNFLVTAYYSRRAKTPLHYVALEKTLLPSQVLAELNHGKQLEVVSDIRQAFLSWRDSLPNAALTTRLRWQFNQLIELTLILGDATQIEIPRLDYHAIYHDAFSPETNPELWTPDFFARLYAVLGPGGKLATYSVKGAVRRNLQAAGFRVHKRPGPPGKREMLVASR